MGKRGKKKGRPDHAGNTHDCLLYRTREQKLASIQQTAEVALTRGERCLLILAAEDAAESVQRLQGAGFDCGGVESGGALIVRTPEDRQQICSSGALADFLRLELGRCKRPSGGTLVIVDSAICAPGTEHEEGLDQVADSEAVRIICLYHLTSRLPATRVIHLMQGHRHTALGECSYREMPGKGQVSYLDEAYSLLIHNENEAVYVADEGGRLLLVNKAAAALLGKSPQEVRGGHLYDFLDAAAWERISRAERQALESGDPVTFRLDASSGGRNRSWLVTSGGYSDGDGAGYTFGIIRDVTELKQTQQKLRFTAELMNVIGQAVIATDRRGTIIFWNRAAEELYGWKALEVLGHDVVEIVPSRPARDEAAQIMKSAGEGQSRSGDFTVRRRDGSEFLAHATDTPIRDETGRLVGVIGISFDITERRRAEQELATSQERFRRYFELGLIGMSVTAPDRRVIEVNDKTCEILGYPREELLQMTWPELTHPDDLAESDKAFRKIMAGECDSYSLEKRYIRKDGQVIDVVLSVGCLRGTDGSVDSFVALMQDVTDRKRAEREIAVYQQQLRLLTAEMYRMEEEERKHLASVLHDEIGQNLALSKMKLELLKTLEGRDLLRQEIEQIGALLDNVITNTRSLTTALRPPVLHELGLKAAVESLCEEFQEQTGLAIHYGDDGKAAPLREAVNSLLFRGVRELLINVVKHAKATRAEVTIARTDAQVKVSVADNGIGFEPSKSRAKGSFGLFSLGERLRHVGGEMEVVSAPGDGTRVELVAPVELPPPPPRKKRRTPSTF